LQRILNSFYFVNFHVVVRQWDALECIL
jgi:hypothetical protein